MSAQSSVAAEKKRKLKSQTSELQPAKKAKQNTSKDKLTPSSQPLASDVTAVGKSKSSNAKSPKRNRESKPEITQSDKEETRVSKLQTEEKNTDRKSSKTKKDKRRSSKNQESVLQKPDSETAIAIRQNITEQEDDLQITSTTAPVARSWKISEPVGGQFLTIDPCYSIDERYMLVATRRMLNVYSLSSSLLVRRFNISQSAAVVDLKISKGNPDLVFVITSDGTISLWNWIIGEQLASVNFGCRIYGLDVAAVEGSHADTLFLIAKSNEGSGQSHIASVVFAHQQTTASQASLEQLSATYSELSHIQILDSGRVIFAASRDTVVLGWSQRLRGNLNTKDEVFKHKWKGIAFPEELTCLHARFNPRLDESKDKPKSALKSNAYSLAIGSTQGMIYVYDDILSIFQDGKRPTPKPRKLHWHRNPVGAIKFSLDGNYIISGGQETTLIIWQLETNKHQNLPHMTAAINRISVSPTGTSYALRLADNSVIVVSTSELAPKAIMSSIQSRSTGQVQEWVTNDVKSLSIAAVENKLAPNEIMVVVPANSDGFAVGQAPAAPFLQTFDISAGRHVTRQALARNNTITINRSPAGRKLDEANVNFIQTSADGHWLATAEEWEPPLADVSETVAAFDDQLLRGQQKQRRESYLKFWKWNAEKQQWALHSRIDSPHRDDAQPHINRIIDLVVNPNGIGFASIGEDYVVRIWRPKSRKRDGTIVRGVTSEAQSTWTCWKALPIAAIPNEVDEEEEVADFQPLKIAKLAYSNDGSVLAVSLDNEQLYVDGTGEIRKAPAKIHLFNGDTGELRNILTGIYFKDLAALQFLGRYLVILSEDLRVWDVVTNSLSFGLKLNETRESSEAQLRLLAVNEELNAFAIAFTKAGDEEVSTRILVFDPRSPNPLLTVDQPGLVTALIPSSSTSGFIAIDAEAEVRLIQPLASTTFLPHMLGQNQELLQEEDAVMQDIDNDSEVEPIDEVKLLADTADGPDDESDVDMDRATFRGNQLAKVFEGTTSHALPSVNELFHAVAKLYIGRA